MRFRTELRVILPIVVAAVSAGPMLIGCKKEDKPAVDGGGKGNDGNKPPVVIHNNDEIPQMLGGAPMPYEPPPQPPASAPSNKGAPSPPPAAPSPPAAQGAAAAAPAPAPAPAPASPPAAVHPSALAIVHNHPPNQPCRPLKREEVEKALSDLQKKSQ